MLLSRGYAARMVGAYESGMVRIWSIQSFSLQTLKNLLQKQRAMEAAAFQTSCKAREQQQQQQQALETREFGVGISLAVSPLALLWEWQAHPGQIMAGRLAPYGREREECIYSKLWSVMQYNTNSAQ
jgi:hypothetical protein